MERKTADSLNDYRAAAARLAVSRSTIARLVHRGDLRFVRIGRRVLISDGEIARFIAGRERANAA